MAELDYLVKGIAEYWVQLKEKRDPRDFIDFWYVIHLCKYHFGDLIIYEQMGALDDPSRDYIQTKVIECLDAWNKFTAPIVSSP